MIERKFGRIINIASQLGHKGAAEMAHYAAAKAGVIGFTRSLAYEVARDGVTVNAICPGPVDTALFREIPEEWRKRKLGEVPLAAPAAWMRLRRRRSCSPPTKDRSTSAQQSIERRRRDDLSAAAATGGRP